MARAAIAHEHRTAAALFGLLVLVYLWPALVGGDSLQPNALLYQYAPWGALTPQGAIDYINPALEDVPFAYYVWDVLARDLIHSGTFPAWNPHAFAGTPFWGNGQVAWLSPFSLPLWLLPLDYGLGVAAGLKLWMAGFGTYLLVRELKLGFWPGIVAGISFAMCTFNIAWLAAGVHVSVAVLLPWTIWLVERLIRRGRAVDGLALAGIVAFVFTGGHPGTQLHLLAATAVYAVVRVLTGTDADQSERLRRLALIGAGVVVGGLIAAVVLLPAQQAAIDTAGAAARRDEIGDFAGSRLTFEALRAALFPDWWGRPSELIIGGPGNYTERAFYAGSATAVLALIGLATAAAWRVKAAFALLAVLGAGVALKLPGLHDLVLNAPLFDQVQNQRLALLFLLGVAVFGAFGLQTLLEGEQPGRRVGVVVLVALAIGPLMLAAANLGEFGLGDVRDAFLRHRDVRANSAIPVASVLWFTIFAGALAGVLLLGRRARRVGLVGGLIALVVALDMLHFAHGYQPMGPTSIVKPPRPPSVDFLQDRRDEGRVAGLEYALMPDWATIYGLNDVRGYDAPQPSLRFHRLWRTIQADQQTRYTYIFTSLSRTTLAVLGTLGARFIVTAPDIDPELPQLTRVYADRDAFVFENELAMPRATVAENVRVAGDEDEERAVVVAEGFDPRRDAVVREDELDGPPPAAGSGTVRIVDEANSEVTLRADLDRRSLVVLGDAWAPGWRVEVDGRPAAALQTDVVLRGVVVPAGSHTITWSYRVPGLRAGALLSLLGVLITAGWGMALIVRARRARPAG